MVAIPATNIAFWSRMAVWAWLRAGWAAPAMMVIGARLETNMARMCWRPKGMALAMGTLPSSLYMLLMLQFVFLFIIGSPCYNDS